MESDARLLAVLMDELASARIEPLLLPLLLPLPSDTRALAAPTPFWPTPRMTRPRTTWRAGPG